MKIDWTLFRWQINKLDEIINDVSKDGDKETLSALNGIQSFLEKYQEDKEDFYDLCNTHIYQSEWPLFVNFARTYLSDETIIKAWSSDKLVEKKWNEYLETNEAKTYLAAYITKHGLE